MSHNPKNGHDRSGFYSRYSPPPSEGIVITDPSKTTQDYAWEANINNLLSKYAQTGLLGSGGVPMQPPTFRDVTHLSGDYHHAMNVVTRAEQLFDAAPVKIRDRFGNQPEALLAFLADPANRKEAEDLGLIEKRPQAAPGASTGGAPPPEPPKTDK